MGDYPMVRNGVSAQLLRETLLRARATSIVVQAAAMSGGLTVLRARTKVHDHNMIIYVDECGYTGVNLLDADQPVFVLATHSISEEDAANAKERHFSHAKVVELKHSELRRKKRHQVAVLEWLRELVSRPDVVRVSLVHKRFALTAKVVDHVIEPVAHAAGFHMDRDGAIFGTAQMLYYVLETEGSSALSHLLAAFQKLARERTDAARQNFLECLRVRYPLPIVDDALDFVRGPAHLLGPRLIHCLPEGALELSLTSALRCICAWRANGHAPLRIVHDDSQNMQRQARVWDWIVSPNAPPAAVGYGAELVEFPLGVEATSFQQSSQSAALQLADVVAGSVCQWANWLNNGMSESDWYCCRLHEVFLSAPEHFFAWICWPTTDIERIDTPVQKQTSLEYLTQRLGQLDRVAP